MTDSGYLIIDGANGQLGSYLASYPQLQVYPQLLLYHRRKDRLAGWHDTPERLIRSCDLLDPGALEAVISEANDHFGAYPSRLIHTAAIRSSDAQSVADCDPEIFYNTMRVNLMSAMHMMKAVLKYMPARGFGRMVFLGSSVTATGLSRGAAYAASKAAIVNLVRSAALENAEHGILINCLSPAPVETELSDDYSGDYLEFRKRYFADHIARTPTHKLVSLQELAVLSVLLLDNALQNLTGQEIYVNGGSL
ncbi:MAG TPA: SDR family oxidoreductase [Candidatus Cloacimonadota bacterium]|nr:SDR family oxidoreductase [Candidatus Cloacimonadota bacterium]